MFGASYQIARVWGIPIKIHVSLIALLAYMGLYGGFSTGMEHGWASGGLALLGTVLMMMLLFGSVALHELGHSFVALRKGCRVRQINLMFIGGAAQMERIPTRPRDEILMAVAGPAVSLILGISIISVALWLRNAGFEGISQMMVYLGALNLVLAGFNLIPAFPMDGGRILRAALTGRLGRMQATLIASRIGKLFAVFMGMSGFFRGQWILVAIAFFIYTAAGAEYRMLQMQEAFRSTRRFFGGTGERNRMRNPFTGFGDDEYSQEYQETDAEPEDEVVVGPPPYRKGPAVKVDIKRENNRHNDHFSP